MRHSRCFAVGLLLLAGRIASGEDEHASGVPDPHRLGERIALIEYARAASFANLVTQDMAHLRLLYAGVTSTTKDELSENLATVGQRDSGVPDPNDLGERGAILYAIQADILTNLQKQDLDWLRHHFQLLQQYMPLRDGDREMAADREEQRNSARVAKEEEERQKRIKELLDIMERQQRLDNETMRAKAALLEAQKERSP